MEETEEADLKHCEDVRYIADTYSSKFLQNLRQLWQEGEFCDMTIHVASRTFHAHKVVLAAGSDYFKAMFSSGMYERESQEIYLHDLLPSTFLLILDFFYTGAVTVTEDNCQDLLAAADMFGLADLVKVCSKFLKTQLNEENCVGIYRFADVHACNSLKADSEKFILQNFVTVALEEEFFDLPKLDLIHFLYSESLCVTSESEVLQAALNWILHDPVSRRMSVFEILAPIRFPIIPEKDITKCLESCHDLSTKVAVQKYLNDFNFDRNLCSELKLHKIKPYLWHPRKSARKVIFVIGGYFHTRGGRWSDMHTLETVDKFDTYSQQWESAPSIRYPRYHMGVTVLNGHIYIVGGEDDSLIFDSVERYDPLTNSWTSVKCLTQPRCGLGLAAVGDCLYAIGGWIGTEFGDTIEEYNPQLEKWQIIGKMPNCRLDMAVLEHEDLIYLVGGRDKDDELGSEMSLVESFNPVTKEWEELCPLNVCRAHAGVTSVGNYIYVAGGFNSRDGDLNSFERYCPEKNYWIELAPMKVKRTSPCMVNVNGLIYVMGGKHDSANLSTFNCQETLNSMECFDTQQNVWVDVGNMLTPRCAAGAVVL